MGKTFSDEGLSSLMSLIKNFAIEHGGGSSSETVNITLASADWSQGAQRKEISGITSGANGVLGVSNFATKTQRDAARLANLAITEQGNGYIIITADGTVPSVDIPVSIIIV